MENITTEELNTRQWKLYNLLKSNEGKWFTEKEICEAIPEYTYKENPKHSTTHCTCIFKDKNAINMNPKPDSIIVCKKHCYKIANRDEYKEERNHHIRSLKSQIEFIRVLDAKHDRDGQGKLLNSDGNAMSKGNKEFFETY